MQQPISGGCACRAVRYEVNAEPVRMVKCHCRDCQRASGSAFAAIVMVPKSAVRLEGELRYFEVTGRSGHPIARGFCPQCGSHVAVSLNAVPDFLGLHAGSLDDPSSFSPSYEVFTSSAQPWDLMAPDTEKFPYSRSG